MDPSQLAAYEAAERHFASLVRTPVRWWLDGHDTAAMRDSGTCVYAIEAVARAARQFSSTEITLGMCFHSRL